MSQNTEAFILLSDCWEHVFDWLPINDVHSSGNTCEQFQCYAGNYFKQNYPALVAQIDDEDKIGGQKLHGFTSYAQKLHFVSGATEEIIKSKYKDARAVVFSHVSLEKPFIISIANELKKTEMIGLNYCTIEGGYYEVLKFCENLKRLTTSYSHGQDWIIQKYPKLEHLKLDYYGRFNDNELSTFLKRNSTLQSLQITAECLIENGNSIVNEKLNDLVVCCKYVDLDVCCISDLSGILNSLHERGCYKRLHLFFDPKNVSSIYPLVSLPGLVTLYLKGHYSPKPRSFVELPFLADLLEFGFDARNIVNVNALVKSCPNIVRLRIWYANIDAMLPFICRSTQLREIEIMFGQVELDISMLNNERKKLEGANKITIYVPERIYLTEKWQKGKTSIDLIKLKRFASHDIDNVHDFWEHTLV